MSTTSEQGWKCGSSLKGRIELLWSQNFKKKEHMSQVKDHNLIFRDLEARETKTAIIRGR